MLHRSPLFDPLLQQRGVEGIDSQVFDRRLVSQRGLEARERTREENPKPIVLPHSLVRFEVPP